MRANTLIPASGESSEVPVQEGLPSRITRTTEQIKLFPKAATRKTGKISK